MTRCLLFTLALLASSGADAARAQPLDGGFERHADVVPTSPLVALACSNDKAFVRTWSGDLAEWDGARWSTLPRLPDPVYGRSLAASRSGRVFTQAGPRILAWDGRTWQAHAVEQGTPEWGAIWAGERGVFVAAQGRVLSLVDGTFRGYSAGTWRDLRGIWGTAGELFLAGQGGTVMRHDGRVFARQTTLTDVSLSGIWGSSPSDVWAWGERGEVHHFDGTRWRPAREGLVGQTKAIGGTAGEVYAVGTFGLAKWAGSGWQTLISGQSIDSAYGLIGVCATQRHIVIADGGGHALVRAR